VRDPRNWLTGRRAFEIEVPTHVRIALKRPASQHSVAGASTFASAREARISFGSYDPPTMTASRQSKKATASHNQARQTRAYDGTGDRTVSVCQNRARCGTRVGMVGLILDCSQRGYRSKRCGC
jgi:hypothetical protein